MIAILVVPYPDHFTTYAIYINYHNQHNCYPIGVILFLSGRMIAGCYAKQNTVGCPNFRDVCKGGLGTSQAKMGSFTWGGAVRKFF